MDDITRSFNQTAAHRYRFPPLESLQAVAESVTAQSAADQFQQGYQEGFSSGQQRGYEEGRQEGIANGQQEGWAEGHALGMTEGSRQGQAVFEEAMAPVKSLSDALEEARQQHLADQADTICDLVTQVARRVIQAELTLNPKQILNLIEEAVGQFVPPPAELFIYLNPEDAQRLAKVGVTALGEHKLQTDPELGTGDCRIETEYAEMSLNTEQRLKQYIESFKIRLDKSGEPV